MQVLTDMCWHKKNKSGDAHQHGVYDSGLHLISCQDIGTLHVCLLRTKSNTGVHHKNQSVDEKHGMT